MSATAAPTRSRLDEAARAAGSIEDPNAVAAAVAKKRRRLVLVFINLAPCNECECAAPSGAENVNRVRAFSGSRR